MPSTPARLPSSSSSHAEPHTLRARTARAVAWPLWRGLWCALVCMGLTACASNGPPIGYYWQSAKGHWQLLQAAKPVSDWIAAPETPQALRTRLQLAQRARAFAVTELHLPDNASYHRYADLQRSAAVWNVVAAPPLSLQLHRWCFAVVGCMGYRGYFSEADAQAEAAQLAAQGLEVAVYGVPAYSTLGYFNWAGGDPLLNTFVHWPEGDFVRLLFHELAHQVVYAEGDTVFNESFATAVERLGSAHWLATQASEATRQAVATAELRRSAWQTLTRAARSRLQAIYEQNKPGVGVEQDVIAMKKEAMQQFKNDYAQLRAQWLAPAKEGAPPPLSTAQVAGYDRWVQRANNASFGAQAAYDEFVPAFVALFAREDRQWPRFYDAVRRLSELPQPERHAQLRALAPPAPQ